jgi:hypothetical protein
MQKCKFFLLGEPVVFDKSSDFVKEVISQHTGLAFTASTKPDDPTIKISLRGPRPESSTRERVLEIPIRGVPLKIIGDETLNIATGGPEPKTPGEPMRVHSIRIGDQEPLNIELDTTKGDWEGKIDWHEGLLILCGPGPGH